MAAAGLVTGPDRRVDPGGRIRRRRAVRRDREPRVAELRRPDPRPNGLLMASIRGEGGNSDACSNYSAEAGAEDLTASGMHGRHLPIELGGQTFARKYPRDSGPVKSSSAPAVDTTGRRRHDRLQSFALCIAFRGIAFRGGRACPPQFVAVLSCWPAEPSDCRRRHRPGRRRPSVPGSPGRRDPAPDPSTALS